MSAAKPSLGIPGADWPTPAARPLNSRLDCGLAQPDWGAGLDRVLAELTTGETAT